MSLYVSLANILHVHVHEIVIIIGTEGDDKQVIYLIWP